MSKYDDAMELLGQVLYEVYESNIPEEVKALIDSLNVTYVVVSWPEIQELMEEDWFEEEAILDVECKFGDSAYFIPLKRIL